MEKQIEVSSMGQKMSWCMILIRILHLGYH